MHTIIVCGVDKAFHFVFPRTFTRHSSGGLGCLRHALPASGVAYCLSKSQTDT
jgi:hypothetical protein